MRTKLYFLLPVIFGAAFTVRGSVSATSPHFYRDDPISREPESQDASGAAVSNMGDLYEMVNNLLAKPGYKPSGRRAQNLNTVDEVPDSGWFTNRV